VPEVEEPLSSAGLPPAEELEALDDPALCQAWRRSFVQLQACRSVRRRSEVVALRQLYLDEMARRHPIQLRRWLQSGARAAGNPLPFLRRRTTETDRRSADLAWPEEP
jgi:hypothetical protein